MQTEFSDLFEEYYSLYRGQGTSVPQFGDREFTVAVFACNSAIRSWERADGQLWRELIDTAQNQDALTGISGDLVISNETLAYSAMNNMRKPPAFVRFYNGSAYEDIETIPPQDAQSYSDLSSVVWFSGGANTGYTMNIGQNLATQYDGWGVDYVYVRKATLLNPNIDPSTTVIDMSDPSYAINKMLYRRFINAKNGSGIKTADRDASIALANMKIEDSSGTYNNAKSLTLDRGWGVNSPANARIKL